MEGGSTHVNKLGRRCVVADKWNYLRAFDALLVSVRTADETDQTAKTLEAILTPPTAAEIKRHTELGDKTVCGDCQDEGRASTEAPFQLIEHLIIKHGGDCCGCAVSKQDGEIVCNECGQTLDVLVSEVALIRMAEALMRTHHTLTATSGLIVHDGCSEHCFSLDHTKDLRFIEETLKLADIDFRALKPLL